MTVTEITQATPVSPEALTVPEVMAALRLSRSKVYDLIRSRELPSFTVGRSRRIPATAIAAFIAGRMEVAA
jgi:excisionase family DNA binding protein